MLIRFQVLGKEQLLVFPYRSGTTPDSTNIGYIDLKKEPERIAEIHELNGYPELQDFVRCLNAPESIFRTLRSDTVRDSFKPPDYTKSVFSHSTIAYDFLECNQDPAMYQSIYELFLDSGLGGALPDSVVADFWLIPTYYKIHEQPGWCLDIWLYGYGNSEKESHGGWSAGLRALKTHFMRMSAANAEHFREASMTPL